MQNSKFACQTVSPGTVKTTLMSIVLFAALFSVPVTKVNAQAECLAICDQQYTQCRNSGGGQQISASCLETYELCVDACLGSFVTLLG